MFSEVIYTPEEVAQHLRVPVEAINADIKKGRLKAITVSDEFVRIRESALNAYKNETVFAETSPSANDAQLELNAASTFLHTWPDKKVEEFNEVSEGIAEYAGRKFHVKVGFTERQSAGRRRRRSLVLVDRYPTVEFVAADLKKSGRMASIIKDPNGKQVPATASGPPEYAGLSVGPYRDVVDGPGASNGLAVICSSDDLATMIRHALIRYAYRQERADTHRATA